MRLAKNSEKYGKELLEVENFLEQFILRYDNVMFNRIFHIKDKKLPLEIFNVSIDTLNRTIQFRDEWNDFESNSFNYYTLEGQIKIAETLNIIDEDFKRYARTNA